MRQLNKEEGTAVVNLTKYGEWAKVRAIMLEFAKECTNLEYKIEGVEGISKEAEYAGRLFASSTIKSLVAMLDTMSQDKKTIDKTYE